MARGRLTFRLAATGGGELRRDLDSLGEGLSRQMVQIERDAAAAVAPHVKQAAPRQSGRLAGSIKPRLAQVVSAAPYAGVIEFGGVIAPRGTPFRIRARRPGWTGARQAFPVVDAIAARRVDALIRTHLPT